MAVQTDLMDLYNRNIILFKLCHKGSAVILDFIIKRFEQLTPKEIYGILKLRNAVFIVEQNCAYQDCDGNDEYAYHLFVKKKGKIAACLRILDKGVTFDKTAIGRLAVEKSYRGAGLARKMMLIAIDFIADQIGLDAIEIQAQSYLIEFYKSLGFKAISDEYLEDGIPHTNMLLDKPFDIIPFI